MSYAHYARIGDIWKHLPLCNLLVIEKPRYYIETNSALAGYPLSHSPERDYGIYTVINSTGMSEIVSGSEFYSAVMKYNNHGEIKYYPGSPGLAMNITGNSIERYFFYDIGDESVSSVRQYADKAGLGHKVLTYKGDSRNLFYSQPEKFNSEDFIHIDPYTVFEKNSEGRSYFDVFLDAVSMGMKSMLWYGFDTGSLRRSFRETAEERVMQAAGSFTVVSTELYLSSICEETVPFNPGVMGCGVMTGNMSSRSLEEMDILSDELVRIYRDAVYDGRYNGRLVKDKFVLSR